MANEAQSLAKPKTAPAALVQNRLGQYTLLEKIAQGGMAQVFKAKTVDPTGIERLVVIKRILPHIFAQPEYVEMLIDEAKIAVHFTHGNIAQIYDLGRAGDDYFIVMEYVDGKTFSQIFKTLQERYQKIPLDILLYCFIELCHGLSYIHRKTGPSGKPLGVVHRDVSPQNIILSYAGNVKIIDFGVAKAAFLESKTEHGVVKGKFAYMSPEQTRGEGIDHRSDIFSLGVLLWEMSTGERLFKRPTNQETVRAVQKAKFDSAQSRRGDVPKALDRIIKKALGKSPRQRYQDAADMALELEKLLFTINPDFRPLHAAKFLYDLFGPEKDEANLPPPYFVGAVKKENKVSTQKKISEEEDAVTVREEIGDDSTPVVKIPLRKRLPGWNWIIGIVAILIFFIGGSYAFFVHQMNKKAYLSFSGVKRDMELYLNGEIRDFPEREMEVKSRMQYQIVIKREGYNDFLQQVEPGAQEKIEIAVDMVKSIPPFGDLTIVSDPPGAAVFLEGVEQKSKTPLTIKNLEHGKKYRLKLSYPEYFDVEKPVTIEGGKEIKWSLPLEPNYASLDVTSEPSGADVLWQGQFVGSTPFRIEQIIPGQSYSLKISGKGFVAHEETLTFSGGDKKSVSAILEPEAPAATPVPELSDNRSVGEP